MSAGTKQVNRESVCVKVSLSLSPLLSCPFLTGGGLHRSSTGVISLPAMRFQTRQQRSWISLFLIQTSLVFNGVIISTPSESLALITCEINVNERPTPSFWPKKRNQNPSRLTKRKKRENICFPSLTVCISYPQIRSVYLCSRMFSKPSVQRD